MTRTRTAFMVNDQEFKKQFANMGIDKESIMNANKANSLHNTAQARTDDSQKATSHPEPAQKEDSQEIMLLKRKMDYLQNNIMAKFNEKFNELEAKIAAKNNSNVDYNRQMTAIKNDLDEVKRKIKCIRVVFTDEPVEKTQSSASTQTSPAPTQTTPASEGGKGSGNPGNIKVEDYFNFSNKKFD